MSTADPAATILLVEDDAPTRTFLADNLTADGYELLVADCARDGLRLLETKFPDVALVDLGLPDGSGLDIVRRVRASDGVASRIDPAVPLVVLSGRAGELDRLRGFERGCDDYVCKPFSYPELRARVEALLRRADVRRRPGRLRVGELEVDAAARVVRLRGAPVELSQKEFALVRTLASDPTRVFTKDELLRTIWGFRTLGQHADAGLPRLPAAPQARAGPATASWSTCGASAIGSSTGRRRSSPRPSRRRRWRRPPPWRRCPCWRSAGRWTRRSSRRGCWRPSASGSAAFWRLQLRRGRELVARACHELRGPLTAAHLALHGGARHGEPPPARVVAVERELDRAAVALEDLAAARHGRRAPDRDEPVDVGDLLAYQALTWRMVAGVFGCRVELVEPRSGATVRGDRVRLTQAVGNLVANALEHGDGRVRLRARAHGDRVRIEVDDEGPGLPAPVGDLTRRPRAGRGRRGRGLAIAADIADRHGGRLVAAPTARGARVALELPAWHDRA